MALAPVRPLAAAVLSLSLAAAPALGAAAAPRTLHWRALDVEARLDARGDLHVVERHAMVFTGDWNGGERVFRVDPGQRLRLVRVSRVDAGGVARPMSEGSLDEVDRWAWVRAVRPTLRWRSRAPHDPPFERTEIGYVLEYVLSGVLVDDGGGAYRLAHDFAFPDRPGSIGEVHARLDVDPAWETSGPLSLSIRDLPPGRSAVLAVTLRWVGAGPAPEAAARRARLRPAPVPPPLRVPLAAAMALALGLAASWVWRHDRRRGLFVPLVEPIDDAWLREHVLSHPPEVIGAAWDDRVGPPEVSAVLARMAAERKLEARLESRAFGFSKVLHLRLLVDRHSLLGYDRRLVDGLFFDGDTTDTRKLRRHYRGKGFDPVSRISGRVREAARALVPLEPRAVWPWWLGAAGLLAVAAAVGAVGVARGAEPFEVAGFAIPALVLFLLAGIAAGFLSSAVARLAPLAVATALPLVAWAGGIAWVAWRGAAAAAWTVAAHAALWSGAVLVVAAIARTRLGARGIVARRRLVEARRHFVRELRRPEPRLDDAWIPYLVGLGLGGDVDRWIRVHGPATVGAARSERARAGSGAGSWSGGGGLFSGGGASGTWAALGSFSAGVASASSHGSGGSGSSSGGGGGGGW